MDAESFEEAIALERLTESEYHLHVPDGWQQGRGAFGGLVLGALHAAMREHETDAVRQPRTFSGELCGPAMAQQARIVTRVLRRGNNQTNLAATLEQDGAIVAHATSTFAAPRRIAAPPALSFEAPPQPAYEATPPLSMGPPTGPRFARNYEYRPTGPLPFSGGDEAIVLGWLRERVPLSRLTAAALIARLDAYWPAIFSRETRFRGAATVSYLAEFLCDPNTLDPKTPLFYRARAVAEYGGYFVEMRELWHGDRVVALNQQTFAILD
jgi:hypothetical protein